MVQKLGREFSHERKRDGEKCFNCGHFHSNTPDFCESISCNCEDFKKIPKNMPEKILSVGPKVSRKTITIDRSIEIELRKIQAEMLLATEKPVSFSHVLNELLKESLKTRSQQYILR